MIMVDQPEAGRDEPLETWLTDATLEGLEAEGLVDMGVERLLALGGICQVQAAVCYAGGDKAEWRRWNDLGRRVEEILAACSRGDGWRERMSDLHTDGLEAHSQGRSAVTAVVGALREGPFRGMDLDSLEAYSFDEETDRGALDSFAARCYREMGGCGDGVVRQRWEVLLRRAQERGAALFTADFEAEHLMPADDAQDLIDTTRAWLDEKGAE